MATFIAATLMAVALPAVTAIAAAGNAVINDCESNGRLTQTYTKEELRHALAVMPASVKTYTNCYDVINQALLGSTPTGGGSGGGGGGSFLPTPVIVILAVLVLGGVTFGALAVRRRQAAARAGDVPGSVDATRELSGGGGSPAEPEDATRELPGGGGSAGPESGPA